MPSKGEVAQAQAQAHAIQCKSCDLVLWRDPWVQVSVWLATGVVDVQELKSINFLVEPVTCLRPGFQTRRRWYRVRCMNRCRCRCRCMQRSSVFNGVVVDVVVVVKVPSRSAQCCMYEPR